MNAPLPSPTPKYDEPSRTPAGEMRAIVEPVKVQTQAQWAVIGAAALGGGGFLAWALATLVGLGTAQAQTQAETTTHAAAIVELRKSQSDTSARLGTVERSTIRIETMLEMSLRAAGLRPPPKADGGP